MKKLWKFIVGIDVSKKTFDLKIRRNDSINWSHQSSFENNKRGFSKLLRWLKKLNVEMHEILFCLENTGIYHRTLVNFLQGKESSVWVESPAQIKWSGGIQRGKTDSVDAGRIMDYAFRYQDKVKIYEAKDETLQQVSDLLSLRARLKAAIMGLKVPIKELKTVGLKQSSEMINASCSESLKGLKKDLKKVDELIKEKIKKDEKLSIQYELVTSVKCIGFVAASHILVSTNAFTKFETVKQFASFSGVAPFEYSSGTSVRRKTKVHSMANKTLKKILHMCAVSSIRHNPEMKVYFVRKVSEGKNKMTVINAIRNKLIARVFSCVKNERMYTASYPGAY